MAIYMVLQPIVWPAGDRYAGEYRRNMSRHGSGMYFYDDGGIYFGEFIDGKGLAVDGIYIYSNGDRFQGSFCGG